MIPALPSLKEGTVRVAETLDRPVAPQLIKLIFQAARFTTEQSLRVINYLDTAANRPLPKYANAAINTGIIALFFLYLQRSEFNRNSTAPIQPSTAVFLLLFIVASIRFMRTAQVLPSAPAALPETPSPRALRRPVAPAAAELVGFVDDRPKILKAMGPLQTINGHAKYGHWHAVQTTTDVLRSFELIEAHSEEFAEEFKKKPKLFRQFTDEFVNAMCNIVESWGLILRKKDPIAPANNGEEWNLETQDPERLEHMIRSSRLLRIYDLANDLEHLQQTYFKTLVAPAE